MARANESGEIVLRDCLALGLACCAAMLASPATAVSYVDGSAQVTFELFPYDTQLFGNTAGDTASLSGQVNASFPGASRPNYVGGSIGGASFSSSASLTRGQVAVSGSASGVQTLTGRPDVFGYEFNRSQGAANFRAEGTIAGPTSDLVSGELRVRFRGNVTQDPIGGMLSYARVQAMVAASVPGLSISNATQSFQINDPPCTSTPTYTCLAGPAVDETIVLPFTVRAGNNFVVYISADAQAIGAATASAETPESVTLVLPAGWSFQAENGAFLTDPVSNPPVSGAHQVPLPLWALALQALLLAAAGGWVARRRRLH